MNIGAMRHRISIMEEQVTKNENGFKSKAWVEVKKVWASLGRDKRTRVVLNEKEVINRTIYFTIRPTSLDLTGHQVAYQNKVYTIESIEEDLEKVVLICIEVV